MPATVCLEQSKSRKAEALYEGFCFFYSEKRLMKVFNFSE